MKQRGRPPRTIARVRAVVEFMETPRATKAAAAEKFYTVERNIEDTLKDPRAKSWRDTPPASRQLILDLERSQADGRRRFAGLTGWRHPKLDFIEKNVAPEELDRRGSESVDDVYALALGRRESRRREARSSSRTKSQRK